MREILYDGFIFYKKHFGKITFINVTLVFPLLALQLWISNYFYVIYEHCSGSTPWNGILVQMRPIEFREVWIALAGFKLAAAESPVGHPLL